MSEKELYFDGADALVGVFAGDPANNVKLFENLFNVKIVARDCWIQIRSDHPASCEQVYAILKELNKIHESGYSIHQKDLEFVLSAGDTKSIKNFYAESIKVSPRKNKIIPRTTTQMDLSNNKLSGLIHAGKILHSITRNRNFKIFLERCCS